MVDFVGILKKAINEQSHATLQLREQVYQRALETLEYKVREGNLPESVADEQRQALKEAILSVEEEYKTIEREFLSFIGWQTTDEESDEGKNQNVLPFQKGFPSVKGAEKGRSVPFGDHQESRTSSTVPDAEPVRMDRVHDPRANHDGAEKGFEPSVSGSSPQTEGFPIISYIFLQAACRANRLSEQRRLMISMAAFFGLMVLSIGLFFIFESIVASQDPQAQRKTNQGFNVLSKETLSDRKFTQRLLADGREIDVGLPSEKGESRDAEGISTVASSRSQSEESSSEAILYQARTDYDSEKVATGSVQWSVIHDSSLKGTRETSAIRGDVTIPDEGLSLQLTLRRNKDPSLPAAYIMDLIFVASDKFSGQAISEIKTLTFKASEQSVGQAFTRAVVSKIDDNFFLFTLSGPPHVLNYNLRMMRELAWIRLVMSDKKGRTNELTFAKGQTGEAIFHEQIGQWLVQTEDATGSH